MTLGKIVAGGLILLGLLVSAGVTRAPTAPDDSREAAELVARMKHALGGEKALSALTGLEVTASCGGPDGPFKTEMASFRPGWAWFRQTKGDRVTEVWTTPSRTWSLDANGQVEDQDPGVRAFVRGHEFHFLIFDLATRFRDHRAGPATTVRERRCRTVTMHDENGQPASIFLDEKTYLPVMLELNPQGAEGAVRVYFDNWKTLARIRLFHGFDLTEGDDRSFRYDYESIKPDVVSVLRFVEPSDRVDDQNALLSILEDNRRAHLDTDAERLVTHIADEILEVSSGAMKRQTRADVLARFQKVFDGAKYERWEDMEPPMMKISADGTLAWVVRRVDVRGQTKEADGKARKSHFVSAYSSTYEKRDGAWKMTSVTSTFLSR